MINNLVLDNLLNAYLFECATMRKYRKYASVAKDEKLFVVANLFDEIAKQEGEHAEVFFNFLPENVKANANVEFTKQIGNTVANLRECIEFEKEEADDKYQKFAVNAAVAGEELISTTFKNIAVAENHHRQRFEDALKGILTTSAWRSIGTNKWECTNCGYVLSAKEAPRMCPACFHARGYYKKDLD